MAQQDDLISVVGAKEHNLKNVDVTIPKKSLVVFCGVSGSGKSSLAFDTIFAEGQRRYVESLSSYARQFLGQAEKPRYETISGLSPTIAIEQKTAGSNPRSTVGTITEIYDYLRVLYARLGEQHCPSCHKLVESGDATAIVERISRLPDGSRILLLAPVVENRKGEHREHIQNLRQSGFSKLRVDGVISSIEDVQNLAKQKKHSIEALVDRLVVKKNQEFTTRLVDSVETALKTGKGRLIVHVLGGEEIPMSEASLCCGFGFAPLDPPAFSFNSPQGCCSECHGLGSVLSVDPDKIIADPKLTIRQGAVIPWQSFFAKESGSKSWGMRRIKAMQRKWGLKLDIPWSKLPQKHRHLVLYGAGDETLTIRWQGKSSKGAWETTEEGILARTLRRYKQSSSEAAKTKYQRFMSQQDCHQCEGARLKPEILAVKFGGLSITELSKLSITEARSFFAELKLSPHQQTIASELIKEIRNRLDFLVNVGLGYLSLDRRGPSLSGGEAQRIRLASQIGSELTGVVYVLDEPSIGLHQRDNKRLIATLCHLRDIGNTVIVIEHDRDAIAAADWLVDVGPGAGHLGGHVVYSGPGEGIKQSPTSLTGRYLSGKEAIEIPQRRPVSHRHPSLGIRGARANNLKKLDCDIPLARFVAICGVSGAGKSTLVKQILYPAVYNQLHAGTLQTGKHSRITGLRHIDKVIAIDQKPIGRTPRSNPATYTKVLDLIRDLYALLPEAKVRGYTKGRFSFNVAGGRCETCKGDGQIKVEMHFLPDVYVNCQACKGRRFNPATLEVTYKGLSIADVLDLSAHQAMEVFGAYPKIRKILQTLIDVGLDYVKLGQAATTLSGGEAQRMKLSRELAKKDTGRTLYILDEPTTGLHFEDIKKLLSVLHTLVDSGNTVLVIEHNLDVIKTADWVLDLGPDGGAGGGYLLAKGTPEDLSQVPDSPTGQFLLDELSACP